MFESNKETKTRASADGLAHDGAHMIDDIKQAAHNIKQDIHESMNVNDWENVAAKTGHEARILADTAGHNLMDTGNALTSKIRDNPMTASLMALGFGFLMGKILRR